MPLGILPVVYTLELLLRFCCDSYMEYPLNFHAAFHCKMIQDLALFKAFAKNKKGHSIRN